MRAAERLYLTADKDSIVGEGSPLAAFLYAAPGDEIPQSAAERFGIVDGRAPAAPKQRRHGEDKSRADGGNKINPESEKGGGGVPDEGASAAPPAGGLKIVRRKGA